MKKRALLFLKITVSALLLIWLFRSISAEQFINTLKELTAGYILLAVALAFAAVFFGVLTWGYILKALNMTLIWKDLWRLYWAGTFRNNFSASGLGLDTFRVYSMQKRDGRGKDAVFSVVIERLMAVFSLGVIGIVAYAACGVEISALPYIFGCAYMVSGLAIFAVYMHKKDISIKHSFAAFFYTIAFHGANIALSFILFKGMAVDVSIKAVCLMAAASSVISMIPVSVNGLGIREGGCVLIGSYFGVPKESALAVSLCYAAVVSLASLYGGYILLANKRHEKGDSVERLRFWG